MRGKHSGVTSDAMSGPYGTATGAVTLEDTTKTTRVTQQGWGYGESWQVPGFIFQILV